MDILKNIVINIVCILLGSSLFLLVVLLPMGLILEFLSTGMDGWAVLMGTTVLILWVCIAAFYKQFEGGE